MCPTYSYLYSLAIWHAYLIRRSIGCRIHGIYLTVHWIAGSTASIAGPLSSRIHGIYLPVHWVADPRHLFDGPVGSKIKCTYPLSHWVGTRFSWVTHDALRQGVTQALLNIWPTPWTSLQSLPNIFQHKNLRHTQWPLTLRKALYGLEGPPTLRNDVSYRVYE